MTKRKPDSVTEFRISLQSKQSEQLDSIIAAFQINKIATPLVALISDASAMLLITGMLEATGVIDLDKGILQRIADGMYENYGDAMKAYLMDPVGVISDPLGIGLAEKGTSSVVKGWIWLMTTGRVLITEPETR